MSNEKKYTDDMPYIAGAQSSIFRYESLQDYSAEDGDEWVTEYIRTEKFSLEPKDAEWWRMIQGKNSSGVRTCRVRLVPEPLTDYIVTELAWLKAAGSYSGEDMRTIRIEAVDAISEGIGDFYLIDDKYLFKMEYGPKGKFTGSVLVEGEDVQKYVEYKKKLVTASFPIE